MGILSLVFLLVLIGTSQVPGEEAAAATGHQESPPASASSSAAAGDYESAAREFLAEARGHAEHERKLQAMAAYMNAAACLKMTGDVSAAALLMNKAEAIRPAELSPGMLMEFHAQKGSVLALGKDPRRALPHLWKAGRLAETAGDTRLLSDVRNDLGIVHSALEEHAKALEWFEGAEKLVPALGDNDLATRVRQNHLIAAFQLWNDARLKLARLRELDDRRESPAVAVREAADTFRRSLERSIEAVRQSPPSPVGTFHALTAGLAAHRYTQLDAPQDTLERSKQAFQLLHRGLRDSRKLGDLQLERQALLTFAEVYLDCDRSDDALALLDQARRITGQASAIQAAQLELLTARGLQAAPTATGGRDIVSTLERAVGILDKVRSDMARTETISDLGRPFRERAGQPYLLLADHYLRRTETDHVQVQDLYRRSRDVIEAFKAWELQDFFRDDCVNLALQHEVSLDAIKDSSVAVLYVIPLRERTEILLGHRGRTHRWTSAVPGDELAALARKFRYRLESDYGTYQFLAEAEALYDAMIRPVRGFLADRKVTHLVVVPDGPLGNIPFAALRDRQAKRYLLEDFSISVSPSLSLTSLNALGDPEGLLYGIDEAVLDYPALSAVRGEIDQLSVLYPQHPPRRNQEFTAASLAIGIRDTPANIVHIACHGEFLGTAGDTFLVASDRRIHLDELEAAIRPKKYRSQPIELLCLSACRTAAGDDRAALGLAGAAVKSGSRSVLATLWYVEDTSGSETMVRFHRNLTTHRSRSKAEALRQAQLDFLRDDPLSHPRFWAPFIIIGNWK